MQKMEYKLLRNTVRGEVVYYGSDETSEQLQQMQVINGKGKFTEKRDYKLMYYLI